MHVLNVVGCIVPCSSVSSSRKLKVLVMEQSEDHGEICHSTFSLNGPVFQVQSNPWVQEMAKGKWEMRKRHEIGDEQRAVGEEIHEEKGFTWMRRGREGNAGIWEGVGVIRVRSSFSFSGIFCQARAWQVLKAGMGCAWETTWLLTNMDRDFSCREKSKRLG